MPPPSDADQRKSAPLKEIKATPISPFLLQEDPKGAIARELPNISKYGETLGWRFSRNIFQGKQEELRELALFALDTAEKQKVVSVEKSAALRASLIADPSTATARSFLVNPLALLQLSEQQLRLLPIQLHLPMSENPIGSSSSYEFKDYTRVRAEFRTPTAQPLKIYGGRMVLACVISTNHEARFDFVPAESLGATHGFDSRLASKLSNAEKLQVKLDFTNDLILLTQSSFLASESSQLLATTSFPDDLNARAFKEIARAGSLNILTRNESFAHYLEDKFGFSVDTGQYGDTVRADFKSLRSRFPALLAIRRSYLMRMMSYDDQLSSG